VADEPQNPSVLQAPPKPAAHSNTLVIVIGLCLVAAAAAVLSHWSGTIGIPSPQSSSPEATPAKFAIRHVDGLIAQDYSFTSRPGDEKLVQVMVGAQVDRDAAVPVDHCIAELQTGTSQVYQQIPDPRTAALPVDARSFGPYWFFIARTDYRKEAQLRLRCGGVITGWTPFQMANLIEKPIVP
jgi:hypothetical protein